MRAVPVLVHLDSFLSLFGGRRGGGGLFKLKCIYGRRGRFGMKLGQEYISKYYGPLLQGRELAHKTRGGTVHETCGQIY